MTVNYPIPKITPKQWKILQLFIIREGLAQEDYILNPRLKLEKGFRALYPDHFYSYPEDIVKYCTTKVESTQDREGSYYSWTHGGYVKDVEVVTKPTAGKACRMFVKEGIFEEKKRGTKTSPPHKKPTATPGKETIRYFLKSDPEAFKKVLFYLMQNCDAYERVEMLSQPYFRRIVTEDLVRLILFENKVSITRKLDIFDWAPNEIQRVLSIFDEKKEGIFDDFEKLIQDEILEKDNLPRYRNDMAEDWVFSFPCLIWGYEVPIFQEGMPFEEKLKKITERNLTHDEASKNLSDAIISFPNFLNYHFKTIEKERLIQPILALIQSSPAALTEFVFGNWEPFTLSQGIFHKKDEEFSNPLFMRLISVAMSDMANTLTIPGNDNVESFKVREIAKQSTINGDRCQEDAILRIGLTWGYEIYYDMGYSTSKKTYPSIMPRIPEGTPSTEKFWVKIRTRQVDPFFIRKTKIKDITLLLASLTANNAISIYIRSKFSNRMQNLLLHYKNITDPASGFITFLIEEINRLLLCEDFYNTEAFREIKISPETQELIDMYDIGVDFRRSTGSNYTVLLHRNRSILDDVFPDALVRLRDV